MARLPGSEGVFFGRGRRGPALLESDLAPLVHLAPVLGLSEGGDQARHLRWARSQLEVKLAGARQRLPEVARLCRALGVCGGLILALLLY